MPTEDSEDSKNSITYLDLLTFFNTSGVADNLRSGEIALAHAIMWEWNMRWRPEHEFPIWNSVLRERAGLANRENLTKRRLQLIHNCRIGDKPLFTYRSEGTRRAGMYSIRTDLDGLGRIRTHLDALGRNGGAFQRSEIRDQRSEISLSRGHDQYIQPEDVAENSESKKNGSNSGQRKWDITDPEVGRVCQILQTAAPGWSPNEGQKEAVLEFIEVEPEKLEAIAEQFRIDGRKRYDLIRYFRTGIDRYDELYLGRGRKDGSKLSKPQLRQRIQSLNTELEEVKSLPATESNFPEGAPSGYQRTPQEVKSDQIVALEKQLAGLNELIRR